MQIQHVTTSTLFPSIIPVSSTPNEKGDNQYKADHPLALQVCLIKSILKRETPTAPDQLLILRLQGGPLNRQLSIADQWSKREDGMLKRRENVVLRQRLDRFAGPLVDMNGL
jgi:hypothetical protein